MSERKANAIADTLRTDILGGKYVATMPLPSVRALMMRFGVARATAAAALKILEREGLAVTQPGSGTYPVKRRVVSFAVILPETQGAFHAAIREGLSLCAEKQGGPAGGYRLLWAEGDPRAFADRCEREKVSGVLFEPFKGRPRLNADLIGRFRAARVPVVLLGGAASSKRTMCDVVGVNRLSGGRRTPILFDSPAAREDPNLLAYASPLGDIAFRMMLQRIANPDHPPFELYLDIPGVARRPAVARKVCARVAGDDRRGIYYWKCDRAAAFHGTGDYAEAEPGKWRDVRRHRDARFILPGED